MVVCTNTAQEDSQFKDSLGYRERGCPRNKQRGLQGDSCRKIQPLEACRAKTIVSSSRQIWFTQFEVSQRCKEDPCHKAQNSKQNKRKPLLCSQSKGNKTKIKNKTTKTQFNSWIIKGIKLKNELKLSNFILIMSGMLLSCALYFVT